MSIVGKYVTQLNYFFYFTQQFLKNTHIRLFILHSILFE